MRLAAGLVVTCPFVPSQGVFSLNPDLPIWVQNLSTHLDYPNLNIVEYPIANTLPKLRCLVG